MQTSTEQIDAAFESSSVSNRERFMNERKKRDAPKSGRASAMRHHKYETPEGIMYQDETMKYKTIVKSIKQAADAINGYAILKIDENRKRLELQFEGV